MAGKYTRILFEAFKLLIGKSQTEMTFKITKNVRWYLLHTKTKQKHLTFGVLIKKKKKKKFESDIVCFRVTHISWSSQRKLNLLEATQTLFHCISVWQK